MIPTRKALGNMAIIVAALMLFAACGGDASHTSTSASTPASAQAVPAEEAAKSSSDQPAFPTVVPLDEPLEGPPEVPEELKAVWEAWALLAREHVDRSTFDPAEFTDAAIRGMITALDDTHTHYLGSEAFDIQGQDLEGKFEGIGAHVQMGPNGKLVVVSPMAGSPAERAGIRPGDVIIAVDGTSIEGLGLLEAVSMIRGPRGSPVVLLVKHLGAIDPEEVVVTRGVIPLASVLLRTEPGERIAHIRVLDFNANTASILEDTIEQTVSAGSEALILDIRNNPGGLLDSAVDVISLFLDGGLVLYKVDGAGIREDLSARRGGVATEIPMVVLANQFSASGSEIVVGALQDHERAKFVGATTFGKGSVGILRRLSNGGGMVVTIARFYTPAGRLIEGEGLEPDIEVVSRDAQTADVSQLERAIEELEAMLDGRDDPAGA